MNEYLYEDLTFKKSTWIKSIIIKSYQIKYTGHLPYK